MKTIQFETIINRELPFVYNNVLVKEVFEAWAKDFSAGSTYVGEIKQSGSINFIDDAKDGIGGFVSDIKENELIEFTFFYQIFNGKPSNLATEIMETFIFEELNNQTKVTVTFTVPEDFVKPLSDAWNKGIIEMKNILENL